MRGGEKRRARAKVDLMYIGVTHTGTYAPTSEQAQELDSLERESWIGPFDTEYSGA